MIIHNEKGLTKIEFIIVISVVVLLSGGLAPLIHKNMNDSKRAQAKNGAVEIALAVLRLFSDVGQWPSTDGDGPNWNPGIDRLVSAPNRVPGEFDREAGKGAEQWGELDQTKALADFIYFNNPDNESGPVGQNQEHQDYPIRGDARWNGPYLKTPEILDPWGQSYVINARYFPGNPRYRGTLKHRVYVLSAGPNQQWETSFDDDTGDSRDIVKGDDIGVMIIERQG